MKNIVLSSALILISYNGFSQENLGVNQSNPQAKTHITNTENQNSFRVDDESGDVSPFVIDSVGNVGIQTSNPQLSLDINTTDAIGIPAGTTIERPAVANEGDLRYNTVLGGLEFFDGSTWQSVQPAGTIQMFGGVSASVPEGWLYCDGSAVSRTIYAELYSKIGDAFGSGDGATTFNLPDLRGRFVRGTDNGSGNDPDAGSRTTSNSGGNTGDNVGSYQGDAAQLPGSFINLNPGSLASFNVLSSSGTLGSETRPKNVNLNFIVKF